MANESDQKSESDRSLVACDSTTRRALLVAGAFGSAGVVGSSLLNNSRNKGATKTEMNETTSRADAKPVREGVRYAPPGKVNTALADAAESRSAVVKLYPETTYDPDSPWTVYSGVTLDYNGAWIELSKDVDVHHIHPGGCVEHPIIDTRHVKGGFSSNVFTFNSKRYGFYGESRSWNVRGGYTRGRLGEGTLYQFVQGGRNAIYFVHADHAVRNIGTVVDMRREDVFGINGNRIYGLWYGFQRGIHMYNQNSLDDYVDNISGNHFDVIVQPEESEILWDLEVGHFNILRGRLWDFDRYSDVMWRIHDSNARRRIGNVMYWFPVGGTKSRLLDGSIAADLFDDKLGDDRNRIVVPWLQGHAVKSFTG